MFGGNSGRRLSWYAAVTSVVALVWGLLAATVLPTPALAAINSFPLATYNAQGATHGRTDSTWTTVVTRLLRRADVVALQEIGSNPPPSALVLPSIQFRGLPALSQPNAPNAGPPNNYPADRSNTVQHSRWRGPGLADYEVYFLQTDRHGGNYVQGQNEALVTQREADQVTIVDVPQVAQAWQRRVLGVRFGDTWYFTYHARPFGDPVRNGSPNALAAVSAWVAADAAATGQPRQWIVMGDFNMTPAQLQPHIPAGSRIYNTGLPTHDSRNEWDYAVGSALPVPLPTERVGGFSSDHHGVGFGQLHAAAGPEEPFSTPRELDNMQSGGVLAASNGGTGNNTEIISWEHLGKTDQGWHLDFSSDDTVRLRGVGSNRCVDVSSGWPWQPAAGHLVLWDCNDTATQRWVMDYRGEDELRLRSSVNTGQCLDLTGNTNTPNDARATLANCDDNTASQLWLITPWVAANEQTVPAPSDNHPDVRVNLTGSHTLQNLRTGGVAAASNHGIANGTEIISWHRLNTGEQAWNVTFADDGTAQLTGRESNRCMDVAPAPWWQPWQPWEGRHLLLGDCNSSHPWVPVYDGDDEYELQFGADRSLCMGVTGILDRPDDGRLFLAKCGTDAAQRWLFGPEGPATGLQSLPDANS